MLQLRISTPERLTPRIINLLAGDPATSTLSIFEGASVLPEGDLIIAEVARVGADELVHELIELGVHRDGSIMLQPMKAWVSRRGFEAERARTGAGADAIVWVDVTQRAYDDSELNWIFLSFITMATLIAGIAIILDSQILTVGAMVLGPEFGCIAALGVALLQRRWRLFGYAARSLVVGFLVAMLVTTAVTLAGRALHWVTLAEVVSKRADTAFIYKPDRWSFIVAIIAAAAGVLSLTSARTGGLSGVFISVTTIPAAANVGVGLAFGAWGEVWGSAAQLGINLSAMAVSGAATLAVQKWLWGRFVLRSWREKRGRSLSSQ